VLRRVEARVALAVLAAVDARLRAGAGSVIMH